MSNDLPTPTNGRIVLDEARIETYKRGVNFSAQLALKAGSLFETAARLHDEARNTFRQSEEARKRAEADARAGLNIPTESDPNVSWDVDVEAGCLVRNIGRRPR